MDIELKIAVDGIELKRGSTYAIQLPKLSTKEVARVAAVIRQEGIKAGVTFLVFDNKIRFLRPEEIPNGILQRN